ncbi:MAG TPA: hypothetical protein VGD77_00225 [Gemmatimonadaceae bacterium]
MRRLFLAALALPVALAACDNKTKEQLSTLQVADSVRRDSLLAIKNELLNDVLVSTQFVTDINNELSQARSLSAKMKAEGTRSGTEGEQLREDRVVVLGRIRELVARLDSTEKRLASTRARAQRLAASDSTLAKQVAMYEQTIAGLKETVERQRAEYEAIIAGKDVEIAGLAKEKESLTGTVGELTTEKNTVYVVAGTKEELVKKGVLVNEGGRRFLILGSRPVQLARSLDPAAFQKLDRTKETHIALPPGNYTILTRQDTAAAKPDAMVKGKISGGLEIQEPERFWAASKFLVLMKS